MQCPVLRSDETGSEGSGGHESCPVGTGTVLSIGLLRSLFLICGVKWTTQLFPTQYLNSHSPDLVSQSSRGPSYFQSLRGLYY